MVLSVVVVEAEVMVGVVVGVVLGGVVVAVCS